ncbi:MAG: IclR family transcriptional regulator [Sphingomonadales bacterium]|nr:IclR family transcriptional regulator [Sphingomonadales bacterium]
MPSAKASTSPNTANAPTTTDLPEFGGAGDPPPLLPPVPPSDVPPANALRPEPAAPASFFASGGGRAGRVVASAAGGKYPDLRRAERGLVHGIAGRLTTHPPPDPASAERRAPAPQSVTRVIRILEALCAADGAMSLADLARVLTTPKSSLAALLRGLAEERLVVAHDGTWRLGPGAFGLGSALLAARRRQSTPDLLRDGLRRLAERSGETALFAVADADGASMTYVDVVESGNAVRFAVRAGDRRPLYATAGGRALLAARSAEQVAEYLADLRAEPLTAKAETATPVLAEAIAAARREGVAQTVDQAADGVTGTAAPIRDADGAVLGALVVAAPSARWSNGERDPAQLRAMVRDEAAALSAALGWRARPL